MIFSAQKTDAPEIADLWNHYVLNSTATFRSQTYKVTEIEAIIDECQAANCPFLVARNEKFLGFALYRQYRKGDGYAMTMEHTIYLDKAARGRGVGRKLMAALEEHGRKQKVHSFIGGVTADNQDSIDFHTKLGFRFAGRIPQVAKKFGDWHDIAFMQKFLEH